MRTNPKSGVISVPEQNQAIQIHDNYRWLLLSKRGFYVFFCSQCPCNHPASDFRQCGQFFGLVLDLDGCASVITTK